MLVQEVAAKYPGRVTFVSENFGGSKLADRYGVKGYPAVFVDDVLVAVPRDFGYFGEVEGTGRYAPWRNADNQAKFKADLIRMIDLILAGKKDVVSQEHAGTSASIHEFWATWCPPCRSTLQWLGQLQHQYGDKLAVVALAVESPEDQIRSTVKSLSPDLHWAIADASTAAAFGDITSVPTLFLFDPTGKTAQVLYGAPPDLHTQAEKKLASLME